MTVGKGTAQIVVTKQAAYIKGDDAFWKDAGGGNADALVDTLNGRWLKSKPDPEISGLCGLGTGMIGEMKSAIPKDGKVHVGAQSRIGDAVVIELNDGGKSSAGSLFISVEAPHYIRRVDAGDQGTLTLSGFGDKKPVKVPSAAESYSVE